MRWLPVKQLYSQRWADIWRNSDCLERVFWCSHVIHRTQTTSDWVLDEKLLLFHIEYNVACRVLLYQSRKRPEGVCRAVGQVDRRHLESNTTVSWYEEDGHCRLDYGSVNTTLALKLHGLYCVANVKTRHFAFPAKFLMDHCTERGDTCLLKKAWPLVLAR